MTKGKTDDLDVILGARIRQVRKSKRMSQEKLGLDLGLTFQQIQKYEKGTNRVSVATLVRLCRVLDSDPALMVAELARAAGGERGRI